VRTSVTAFAPATVGNVGIGFDILGHTVEAIGDTVHLTRAAAPGVRILGITGVETDLPLETERNTAGKALASLIAAAGVDFGVEMRIEKGIPLGSGLGGSAASAVAAVVAGNALLPQPLSKLELLKYAMQGEAVSSGSVHVDNIAPSLFGGLVLTVGVDHPRTKQIPVPPGVRCVLVHPHMFLSTKEARRILSKTVNLSDLVWQCANLAGFISACYTNDLDMIRDAFEDVVVEPQRQALIPGFRAVKQAAMGAGALGCSISGAGPTIFAWCLEADAGRIADGMVGAFAAHGLACDRWISAIEPHGARVID
jgi:homoserine kinase